MNNGYIKDYRKEIDSNIWKMPPLYYKVWQYLKYTVNHKSNSVPFKNGDIINVNAGETLTSYRRLIDAVSWYEDGREIAPSTKTIKRILDWLQSQEMIYIYDKEAGQKRKYTRIKIVNYEKYQMPENTQKGEHEGNTNKTQSQQGVEGGKNEGGKQNGNRLEKQTRMKENDKKKTREKIAALYSNYSTDEKETIKKYWQAIKQTRKTNKIADTVILKNMQYWQKFNNDVVIYSLETHLSKYSDKREEYTNGIIRRAENEGIPKQDEKITKQPAKLDINNLF